MKDRVSVHGPLIRKTTAQALGVLETATGFEQLESGAWKAKTPADTPVEQSGSQPSQQVTYRSIRVEETKDGLTTVDPKGVRQTFSDASSCSAYLSQTLGGEFKVVKKKPGVYFASRKK